MLEKKSLSDLYNFANRERGQDKCSRNDAHEQHGRRLAGLGLGGRGVYLLVVGDFKANGLLAMVQMQVVTHVFFE